MIDGSTPMASAIIRSAQGQLCRRAFDSVPALYWLVIESRRKLKPLFHNAATISALVQSVDAGVGFVFRFCRDMA
jgi:hypothetical protein